MWEVVRGVCLSPFAYLFIKLRCFVVWVQSCANFGILSHFGVGMTGWVHSTGEQKSWSWTQGPLEEISVWTTETYFRVHPLWMRFPNKRVFLEHNLMRTISNINWWFFVGAWICILMLLIREDATKYSILNENVKLYTTMCQLCVRCIYMCVCVCSYKRAWDDL